VSGKRVVFTFIAVVLFAASPSSVLSDSVISSEEKRILEAGKFENSSQWDFSSSKGFTLDQAEFSIGMVADGEMSFTHSRPDNFGEFTAWASAGCTDCNATFGEADGVYAWSRGPDITMSGYLFSGLHSKEIENVSLVLHFSIPDPLNEDEVNVLLQNHGSDMLVTTYARTLVAVNRMANPLIVPLDNFVEWDWAKLEETQFTVDYVSDNQGADDSEVRVDAVGLKVKFHQPWYSFENVKAEHQSILADVPVIDFSTYDGEISGLSHSTCGLTPDGSDVSNWDFEVIAPPNQEVGRIHVFGEGNYSIWAQSGGEGGEYLEVNSSQVLGDSSDLISSQFLGDSSSNIRVSIEDGCVSGARADINDPKLIVSGRVAGSVSGLSHPSSRLLFAVGKFLVHTEVMDAGTFNITVPVGHALPLEGGLLEVGIAARFQWSSNGTAETTVVHVESLGISGGYEIEWDRDPNCNEIGSVSLVEDEGGQIIAFDSLCNDDITDSQNLIVTAHSSNVSLLVATGNGSLLSIEPVGDANGEAMVSITVSDEAGNVWESSLPVSIQAVPDPPEIEFMPSSLYIELGESKKFEPEIYDPDSEVLTITTSRSWATVDNNGSITLTPVEVGTHTLTITFSDGTSEVSRDVEVVVTAKPDLRVETVDIRLAGLEGESLSHGDVVEVVGYIRNQGRGIAENVTFYCRMNGILVGTGAINQLEPGDLKMAVCDIQLIAEGGEVAISIEIDGTNSIEESLEGNNELEVIAIIDGEDVIGGGNDEGAILVIVSVLVILASLAAYKIGPRPVKKDFGRRK